MCGNILALSDYALMDVLSHAIRGVIVAAPGKALFVADFASIEARVVLWLAGDTTALKLFGHQGVDIYGAFASEFYGYPVTKETHPRERALFKVAVLALVYQMGWSEFQATALAMEKLVITDDVAQQVVTAYREKYWRVKEMWNAQEAAAIRAVARPHHVVKSAMVEWVTAGRFLYCQLPSGRRLAYPDPEVHTRSTPWGAERPALTFMGINSYTRKWERQHTYGGSLVENITQSVARDLLAHALLSCEEDGRFLPVLSAHDEVVAEGELGLNIQDFSALVTNCPQWADGLPIAAEAWSGQRYRKG